MTQSSATLVLFAYIFVLFGSLGSFIASASPYWFTNRKFRINYGIFTCSTDKEFSFMPGPLLIFIIPEVILYALGLALCWASAIASSIHVCCFKSNGHKLCNIAGYLGLTSVISFLGLFMKLYPRFKGQEIGWTVILAIVSTLVILVASVLHLVAGRIEKSKSRMFWSCLYCFPFIC